MLKVIINIQIGLLSNMEKFLIAILCYFTVLTASEGTKTINYMKHLAFVVNGNSYGCPGVFISTTHVVSTGSCVMRNKGNLKVFVGDTYHPYKPEIPDNYKSVVQVAYEDDLEDKLQSGRIQNSLAVLTIDSEFSNQDNDIRVTKLPKRRPDLGTDGVIIGWNHCGSDSVPRIITANMTILDDRYCYLHSDEFCSRDNMIDRIHHASPVLSGDTIIGFTTFGCPLNSGHAVTDIYSHLRFINSTIYYSYI